MKGRIWDCSLRLDRGWFLWASVFGLFVATAEAQPGGGPPRGGMSFFEPGSILPELRKDEFLTELKFTDEQRDKLRRLRSEFGPKLFSSPSPEDQKKAFQEYEEKAVELLTAEQKTLWEKRKAEIVAKLKEDGGTAAPGGGTPGNGVPPARPAMRPRAFTVGPVPEGAKVTASFDAPPGDSASDGTPQLQFNFSFAPWAEVLEHFAAKAGLTLDLQDTPPGTFTYRDQNSYTPTQALDVLNGYLLPRGYLLVRRDRFLVCLNITDKIPPNLAPQVSVEELAERGKNELVSVVIPLKGVQADQMVAEVRELLGPQGTASALKNTNSIVVTDIGSHVRRIHALLTSDSAVDTRENAFKAIPLQHISATEAERTVRRLFGLTTMTTSSSQPQAAASPQGGPPGGGFPTFGGFRGFGGWDRRRGDRDRDRDRDNDSEEQRGPPSGGPPSPAPVASNSSSQFANKIFLAADLRTNQLLVTASPQLLSVVEDAVKTLDTEVNAATTVDIPLAFKIYTVPEGDLAAIAQTIDLMVPGVVVGQDPKLGRLHTQATPDEHKRIAELIAELSGEGSGSVAVIPLQRMDPVQLAATLTSLYSKEGARAPTVEADPVGRRLIVRGTPDQVQQVKTILNQLGEGDVATRERTDRGNVRSLTLGGRDPDEILPLLRDAWSATRPNPIRIRRDLSTPSPIRGRAVPGADRPPQRNDGPLSEAAPPHSEFIRKAALESVTDESSDDGSPASDAESAADAEDEASADEAETSPDDAAAPQETDAAAEPTAEPISVQVVGDQVIISGSDTQALDRFEELFDRVSTAVPLRNKWNVFYLRTADATECAQMIEQMLPQSSVTTSTASSGGFLGGFSSGFSSFGRGLMNSTGLNQTLSASLSLRIVTDVRSNALYVSGPHDQVAEVEMLLEVLDSTDLPDSLRDRLPREIPVLYADVEEVAKVVESVFEDAMTPESPFPGGQNGGRGGFNPFMMLMAGAGQQNGRRQPSVQLTVGVDKRTNHLIVSCNDALFRQVEDVVKGIDERAKEARQTVRVVRLNQADPILVQRSLGSLMPKVTVGSTATSRSDSDRRSSDRSRDRDRSRSDRSDDSRSDRDREAAREAFFQRMRERGGFGRDSGRDSDRRSERGSDGSRDRRGGSRFGRD